ncbi:hypothetical protein N7513_011142 [Penicillium frequentans]|nr:hypothetical protein N7513_011142 [Penicillium glabrum]
MARQMWIDHVWFSYHPAPPIDIAEYINGPHNVLTNAAAWATREARLNFPSSTLELVVFVTSFIPGFGH